MFFRTVVREHIPKRSCNFEVPIVSNKPLDSTMDRIYGEKKPVPFVSESSHVGAGYNPADALPKFGKKTMAAEQEIMRAVAE